MEEVAEDHRRRDRRSSGVHRRDQRVLSGTTEVDQVRCCRIGGSAVTFSGTAACAGEACSNSHTGLPGTVDRHGAVSRSAGAVEVQQRRQSLAFQQVRVSQTVNDGLDIVDVGRWLALTGDEVPAGEGEPRIHQDL